jgi:polar amino acid transport system substrate-binding protein
MEPPPGRRPAAGGSREQPWGAEENSNDPTPRHSRHPQRSPTGASDRLALRMGLKKLSLKLLLPLLLAAALVAGCGSSDDETTATAGSCKPGKLATKQSGVLTIATDKPAYPPYFEDNDPANGKGFESAVAYAIADQLGYPKAKVEWVVESFNSSYAPGPKDFDFDLNQISISPVREKAVDFSSPYYTANQAVVALKGSDAAGAKSLADLQETQIGVQIGTTSLDAVDEEIDPSEQPQVFNNSSDVVTALKNGQIDAVVVDLPTALYLTAVQVPEATVTGQFSAPGGDQWGALLEKDSSLTPCVSEAVDELRESGELQRLTERWMSQAAGAPELR